MTSHTDTYKGRLSILQSSSVANTLTGIRHGVEREALRINGNGSLSQNGHPQALGSALTHETITTDFSESLLEFITPPETDPSKTLAQLKDIHKYVMESIGDEQLWPLSMPCYVSHEDQIPIARYGDSNVGKMKSLYRVGLKNRYGSMMQAISGVHFNFSLPEDFWQHWLKEAEQQSHDKDNVSAAYFGLIRNYRRLCWLIPYLFGASPALCGSFIKDKQSTLDFSKLGDGTLYLPYATSLRMSDLGYTNSAQSSLFICYNEVDTYIRSLRSAINTPSEEYKRFAGKQNGEYQQLNSNVLQIENELYSPIRPKQPTYSMEKPTDALAERGVSYIEVRALDVDPFSDVGISKQHFYFLDVFLLYCLVKPSKLMDKDGFMRTEENLNRTVLRGRDPALTLATSAGDVPMREWAAELFSDMREIAAVLDKANGTSDYSEATEAQWQKIEQPELTPSGKLLSILLNENKDNGTLGLELASNYKQQLLECEYRLFTHKQMQEQAAQSVLEQKAVEDADEVSFENFIADYFGVPFEADKKLA